MTRDDIIRMAQEAGAIPSGDPREWDVWLFQGPAMARFAALVAAAEREACAKVCENIRFPDSYTAIRCAAAIRARGDEMNADGHVNTLQRRLEKRFAEIDQLRADAERYRWACDHVLAIDLVADPDNFAQVWVGTDPARVFRGKTLDDAVSEAMKEAALRREEK